MIMWREGLESYFNIDKVLTIPYGNRVWEFSPGVSALMVNDEIMIAKPRTIGGGHTLTSFMCLSTEISSIKPDFRRSRCLSA